MNLITERIGFEMVSPVYLLYRPTKPRTAEW
jgi:hypothetical protein